MVGIIFGGLGAGLGAVIVAALGKIGIPAPNDVSYFFFSGPRLHLVLSSANLIEGAGHRVRGQRRVELLSGLARDARQPTSGHAGGGIVMANLGTNFRIAFRSLLQHSRRTHVPRRRPSRR